MIIPKASISMEEGTIVRWLLDEGETVSTQSVLFELETDKAIVEVPSPASGVLLKILSPSGPVKVEAVVGWVGAPGESVDGKASAELVDTEGHREPSAHDRTLKHAFRLVNARRAKTRWRTGVKLSTLTGSGPNGGGLLRTM